MQSYQPKKMLITGGAGFIGANFIHYLLKTDPLIKLINLDKLTYAASLNYLKDLPDPTRHHFVEGDICDTALVKQLMHANNIDTIVHFAAESHVDRSITSPHDFIHTNIVGTFNLLNVAKEYWASTLKLNPTQCRFHHISTDEVYGSLDLTVPAFTEKNPYQPRSPYSASKAGSDHLVQAFYHTYGLPITLSNCSNNYGPFQHPEKLIPTIIQSCLQKKSIPIYGNGKNIRDWLYVEDHCHAILSILKHGQLGETYNIGGENEWENLTLAEYICEQMDKVMPAEKPYSQLLSYVKDRPGHDFRYAIDSKKIKQTLGWQSQTTLAKGLDKTIQYFLKNGK